MLPIRTTPLVLGLFTLAALTLPACAQGAPRSMAECERLKNDLAYNQCLAMFGPAAKNVGGGEGGGPSSSSVAAALAAIPPGAAVALPIVREPVQEVTRGRRGRGRYARGGRRSASFTVGGGGSRSYRRHSRRR